jgi:Domain of unknown function (DUF1974)
MDMSGMEDVLEISMEQLLLENQTAIYGVADNFPVPVVGPLIKALCFPLGSCLTESLKKFYTEQVDYTSFRKKQSNK